MQLSEKEAALIRRIRDEFARRPFDEWEITVKGGPRYGMRVKLVEVYETLPHGLSPEGLAEFIANFSPFGDVTVRSRKGQPYQLVKTIMYDELSYGL